MMLPRDSFFNGTNGSLAASHLDFFECEAIFAQQRCPFIATVVAIDNILAAFSQ
jgi:hypothetical protein